MSVRWLKLNKDLIVLSLNEPNQTSQIMSLKWSIRVMISLTLYVNHILVKEKSIKAERKKMII